MRIILSSHVPERGTYYNAVPISVNVVTCLRNEKGIYCWAFLELQKKRITLKIKIP